GEAREWRQLGARTTADLAEVPVNGSRADAWTASGPKPIEPDTSIGGIVATCRQLKTRKGDRMAVFTLEDSAGGVEVITFPETYQRAASPLEGGTPGLVRGELDGDGGAGRSPAGAGAPVEEPGRARERAGAPRVAIAAGP